MPYFTTKILNLNTFTNIKNAINNHNIYVEENLPELVDPKTRRVYNDEVLEKKCIFILEYTLHFKENPNILGSPEYTPVYTRIVKALRTEYDFSNTMFSNTMIRNALEEFKTFEGAVNKILEEKN